MKVASVNIASPRTVEWNGKQIETGIYKFAMENGIYLGKNGVLKDTIADKRVHGGPESAAYIFSVDHYPYWKEIYPDLDWKFGMFGENITVSGMNERYIRIGDIFRLGESLVQVSQPRQPCFKLGIRFGNQGIIKQFIEKGHCGFYVRVVEEGKVEKGADFNLLNRMPNSPTISEVFQVLYHNVRDKDIIQRILEDDNLSEACKKTIRKRVAILE